MLPRSRVIRALCWIALIISRATAFGTPTGILTPAAPFIVEGLGRGTVPLDGPWKFHIGDNPAWSIPAFDDSQWEQLSGDRTWGIQSHAGYTGYAWYRLHIQRRFAASAPEDVALLFPAVNDAYQVYWNGNLIGGQGRLPPRPNWYVHNIPQTLGLGPAHDGVLAVRVWKSELLFSDPTTKGGFTAPIQIGSPQVIASVLSQSVSGKILGNAFSTSLYSVYFLVGLAALILWLRDRSKALFFWTACYLIDVAIGSLIDLRGELMEPLRTTITTATTCIENISLWFLLCWLLNLRENRWLMRLTRVAAACLIGAAIARCLFASAGMQSLHGAAFQIPEAVLTSLTAAFGIWNLVPVAVAVFSRVRLDHARWFLAVTSSLAQSFFVTGMVLGLGQRFTHLSISGYSFRTLFLFNGSIIVLQNLSDSLFLLALIYAIYRFSVEGRDRQAALEQEFRNARELQQVLIPESLPEISGFMVTSAYKPALEVGGDFFQVISLADGSTLIVLGDVSGKGLRAAMAVSLIVGAMRMAAEVTASPAGILSALNRCLDGRLNGGFATCVAMRLQMDGSCSIASAGHPGPFLNGDEISLPGALPLGLTPNSECEEIMLTLRPGDHFALYSDGLLEARSASGELYGFERMKTLFAPGPTAEQAVEAAVQFGQDDDITVISVTRAFCLNPALA